MRYGKASERLYRGAPSVYNGEGGEDPKISASPVVHFSSTSDEHISFSIIKDGVANCAMYMVDCCTSAS